MTDGLEPQLGRRPDRAEPGPGRRPRVRTAHHLQRRWIDQCDLRHCRVRPLITGRPGPDGLYNPLVPARLLDTRNGTGAVAGPLPGGSTLTLQVTGRGGVPLTGVSAVVLNVTVTSPTATGYLRVFPAGTAVPLASNLNFVAGQTVPNRVIVMLGAG